MNFKWINLQAIQRKDQPFAVGAHLSGLGLAVQRHQNVHVSVLRRDLNIKDFKGCLRHGVRWRNDSVCGKSQSGEVSGSHVRQIHRFGLMRR